MLLECTISETLFCDLRPFEADFDVAGAVAAKRPISVASCVRTLLPRMAFLSYVYDI